MSVRNVSSPSVLEPPPPGRHFAACVHEIQFELRLDQSVSGKNNPSFCSRFCLNLYDKTSVQNFGVSHFLTSAGGSFLRGFSDSRVSRISRNKLVPLQACLQFTVSPVVARYLSLCCFAASSTYL